MAFYQEGHEVYEMIERAYREGMVKSAEQLIESIESPALLIEVEEAATGRKLPSFLMPGLLYQMLSILREMDDDLIMRFGQPTKMGFAKDDKLYTVGSEEAAQNRKEYRDQA